MASPRLMPACFLLSVCLFLSFFFASFPALIPASFSFCLLLFLFPLPFFFIVVVFCSGGWLCQRNIVSFSQRSRRAADTFHMFCVSRINRIHSDHCKKRKENKRRGGEILFTHNKHKSRKRLGSKEGNNTLLIKTMAWCLLF